jgi:penicillin-binding protein 1C
MDGVSGVSGAGPLLHRAVLLTADRYPPGALQTPRETGAIPARICRLSGLIATNRCPAMTEWFAPGQVPERSCGWHLPNGGVRLPAQFADWAHASAREDATASDVGLLSTNDDFSGRPAVQVARAPASSAVEPFRIVSPEDGDEYDVPPGVASRYATIALRAGGGRGSAIRWSVDGRPVPGARWTLRAGSHRVRAEDASGAWAEVRITVD